MKKSRVIAFALLVVMMLVGVGYSHWTDKLTINNTVSTGELNVKFVEPNAVADNEGGGSYVTPTIAPDPINTGTNVKALELTMHNLYPGVTVTFNGKILNDGTIPAVIKSITYNSDLTANLVGLNGKTLAKMTDDEKAKIKVVGTLRHAGKIVPPGQDGTIQTKLLDTNLRDLGTVLSNLNWRLEPNEFIRLEDLKFTLPCNAVEGDQLENKYAKFKLEINFGQHNCN